MEQYVIYGSGNAGKRIVKLLSENGSLPVAFLDNNVNGNVAGIPVYSPNSFPHGLTDKKIILSVHNRSVDISALTHTIKTLGWPSDSIFNLVQFYRQAESFEWKLPELFWLGANPSEQQNKHIQQARSYFCDSQSLRCFDAQLELRRTGKYTEELSIPEPKQYGIELINKSVPLNFVDVGAYDGDTIVDLWNFGYRFNQVYCFEPDKKNIQALQSRLRTLPAQFPVTVFPIGLNDRFETLHFNEGAGESSCFSNSGDTVIQTAPLDDLLINQPVSYIKMDIEGAELAALQGCKRIIQQQHPVLAICVYHHPEHLWEIPHLIKEMNPNYNLYLRCHGYNCFETVCYAVDSHDVKQPV